MNSFILCLNLKLLHGYYHDHNFDSTSGSKIDRKWINKLSYGYITSLCIWIEHPIIENKASCKNIFIILIAANCFFDRVQVSELSWYRTFTSYQEKTFQYSILSPPWWAISSVWWVLDEARSSTVLLPPRKFLKKCAAKTIWLSKSTPKALFFQWWSHCNNYTFLVMNKIMGSWIW